MPAFESAPTKPRTVAKWLAVGASTILLGAALFALAGLVASPASSVGARASPAAPDPPEITVSPTQGPIGATVTVSGTNFSASSTVALSFRGASITTCASGSLTTDATGSFVCTFAVPTPIKVAGVNVGSEPCASAYDGTNGDVYIANYYSGNVSVISGTAVIATVHVGIEPVDVTYDGGNGDVYVVNEGSNNVSVIAGTSVVATVSVGSHPQYSTYDSENGDVYVANEGSNNVSLIDGTTVATTVRVGTYPQSSTYDSGNGYVYVLNEDSNNVSVIDGTAVVAAVHVAPYPQQSTYDGANGDVYVLCPYTNNVSVISGTAVVATVYVGSDPSASTYDSGNGHVYVVNYYSGSASVISGTTVVATVPVGSGPFAATYDSRNQFVYVTNARSDTVSVINGTSVVATVRVGSDPDYVTPDSGNGDVYVTNAYSATVNVITESAGSAVTARDASGQSASGTFTVTVPAITVSPAQGGVGATVTVSGTGFSVSTTVTLSFDSVAISRCTTGSLRASGTGSFSCAFLVPSGTTGTTVKATDVGGSTASGAFTVTKLVIKLSPTRGPVGSQVTVSGTGFAASTKLKSLVFDSKTITSCTSGSLIAGGTGSFSCTFKVPSGTSGTTVKATDANGAAATGTFTVTSPAITVSPTKGPVGSSVTVSGTGFSVSTKVKSLVFDSKTISSCTSGSFTTGPTGAFSCTFKVPSGTSGTTVKATDVGGKTATGKYTVTKAAISALATPSGALPGRASPLNPSGGRAGLFAGPQGILPGIGALFVRRPQSRRVVRYRMEGGTCDVESGIPSRTRPTDLIATTRDRGWADE